MPLALTVVLAVLGVTVLAGAVGYLMDKSAEPGEPKQKGTKTGS
jgi:hypothetical protein